MAAWCIVVSKMTVSSASERLARAAEEQKLITDRANQEIEKSMGQVRRLGLQPLHAQL